MPMLEGPKKMESQESGIYGECMDIDRASPRENGHFFGLPSQECVYDPADELFRIFEQLSMQEQMDSVKALISRMTFHQHEHIFSFLMPMLQRDFISTLTGVCVCVCVCARAYVCACFTKIVCEWPHTVKLADWLHETSTCMRACVNAVHMCFSEHPTLH